MKKPEGDDKKGPREQIARTYQLTQSLMKLLMNLDHERASNEKRSDESEGSSIDTESQAEAQTVAED